MPSKLIFGFLAFFVGCNGLSAQNNHPPRGTDYPAELVNYQNKELLSVQRLEKLTHTSIILSSRVVDLPLNKWTLLKSTDDFCAIRFTEFSRSHENDNNFYYSKEGFQATYQCLCNNEEGIKLNDDNALVEKHAYQRPNIWRFERKSGIQCDAMRFGWRYPTGLIFSPDGDKYVSKSAENFSVSFSGLSNTSDLNSVIHSLKWIKFGDLKNIIHSGESVVPLKDLPGYSAKERVQK